MTSKKMIIKNIILGLFVLAYGAGIIVGLLSESFFSPSVTSLSSVTSAMKESAVIPEGRLFIGAVFLALVVYFILEAMTGKEKSKVNDILHFLLGSEMLFFGAFSLLQGGESWLWFFVVIGLLSAISFSFKAKKWDEKGTKTNG